MQSSQLNYCLSLLRHIAVECAAGTVSPSTRGRVTGSLTILSSTVRNLRTTNPSRIPHFLLRVIPCVTNVFRGALPFNHEIAHQAILVLAVLFGNATHLPVLDKQLEQALSSIPVCFREMAADARKEDVRPLVNAMVMVTTISTHLSASVSSFRLPILFGRSDFKAQKAFMVLLSSVMRGWNLSVNKASWNHVQYLDISKAICVCLGMLMDPGRKRESLGSLLLDVQQIIDDSFTASNKENDLLILSTTTGLLLVIEKSELETKKYGREACEVLMSKLAAHERLLFAFVKIPTYTLLPASCKDAVSLIMLLSTVSVAFCSLASAEQLSALRSAVEVLLLIGTGLKKRDAGNPLDIEFNQQVHYAITNQSTSLGRTYANIVQAERSFHSCLQFLATYASQNSSSATALRIAFTTAMRCNYVPSIATGFIDILSLFQKPPRVAYEGMTEKLIPLVAKEMSAVHSLGKLIIAVFSEPLSGKHLSRNAFLLSALSQILQKASESSSSTSRVGEESLANESMWLWMVTRMQAVMRSNKTDTRFMSSCISCASRIMSSSSMEFMSARESLLQSLPSFLANEYIFAAISASKRQRTLHTIVILDTISQTIGNENHFRSCLQVFAEAGKRRGGDDERTAGLLILRAMIKCHPELLGIAMASANEFVGTDAGRKAELLPLAQAAVLGTDTGRKNACVEWILDCFGDLAKVSRNHKIPSRTPISDQMNGKL